MYSITLKHLEGGIYRKKDYSANEKINLIVTFLSEIGSFSDYVKKCIREDGNFYFQTIYADLENNKVTLFDIDDEDDPPLKLKLPYEKFIKLLDRWWEVYKNLPDFIEISMDNEENIEIKAAEE